VILLASRTRRRPPRSVAAVFLACSNAASTWRSSSGRLSRLAVVGSVTATPIDVAIREITTGSPSTDRTE